MKKIMVLGVLCLVAVMALGTARAGERRGGRRRGQFLQQLLEDAPPGVKEIIQKRINGEEVTPEEREKLRNYIRERGTQMRDRFREDAPEDVRAIMEKRQRGEELTQEERTRMREYMRDRAGQFFRDREAAADRQTARPGQGSPIFTRVEANPRDAALLRIAEIEHGQGDHQEAIGTLAAVTAKTPQPEVKAAAHLATARIYRRDLLLPDKAAEHFLAVRGQMADRAIREMIDMYERTGEPEQAINALKNAAKETDVKADKVLFLGHAAGALLRGGRVDEAIATLQEIVDLLSYDEAMKMMESRAPAQGPLLFPVRR